MDAKPRAAMIIVFIDNSRTPPVRIADIARFSGI
jgi:hypothetical protein